MTRVHCARKLLEHGPLTFCEFMEITGWRKKVADSALARLMAKGVVRQSVERGCNKYLYRLAA